MNQYIIWVSVIFLIVCLPSTSKSENLQTPKTYFFITIDTETSAGCSSTGCSPEPMEDRILGMRGDNYYGIPLMMDMLEKHGMKGTFFVNAYLDSYYPETEVEEIVKNIVDRGHDVQLHTHEEFRCFSICASDEKGCWDQCTNKESYLAGNTLDNQTAIIKEGAQNIAKWSGRYPVAFRGGGFDADINTLLALRALNIPIDSSLSQPGHPLAKVYPINQVSEWEGVVEVPLLNYSEDLIFRESIRFLDVESTTLLEQKYLLGEAAKNDIRTVVLLMHSFSFCRPGLGCPIQDNIERFDNLLAHIKKKPEIEVVTFREFWGKYQNNPEQFRGDAIIPSTNYLHTLHRSFVRFDQGIKNKIFFLGNVMLLIIVFISIGYLTIKRFKARMAKRI